ncbi:MAG: invasion associated locus B family protein [Rhodospirillales bacterium]|nr:invasion associated locus B family protein [Rhodospirillales bacterium]
MGRIIVSLLTLAIFMTQGEARSEQFIGEYGAWSAFTDGAGKEKSCYMFGRPEKREGKHKKRGKTYLLITHWPAKKDRNVVELRAGYTYKKDSEVRVNIGSHGYSLFTRGATAWAQDEKTDLSLALTMIKGARLIARGVSSEGTRTRDTYSLKGFTAAYKAIGKACPVK